MHLLSSNKTGENPKWNSTEPYYDDVFTIWDIFRCTTSLYPILQPKAYEEQIRSLIDIWRHEGYMPDGRSSNYNGRVQGVSNADNVLADAFVKGVRGAVNWTDGFAALQKDVEVQPPNNYDPIAPEASTEEGRGALPDWIRYGWTTPAFTRAVSQAVEYSVNDFGLYQVSKTGLRIRRSILAGHGTGAIIGTLLPLLHLTTSWASLSRVTPMGPSYRKIRSIVASATGPMLTISTRRMPTP